MLIMLAVIIGAFGAHGIEGKVSLRQYEAFRTGALYHFLNSLGLLIVGVLAKIFPEKPLKSVIYLILSGILLFSGSLYIYGIVGLSSVALITPLGGLSFILGWLILAIRFLRS